MGVCGSHNVLMNAAQMSYYMIVGWELVVQLQWKCVILIPIAGHGGQYFIVQFSTVCTCVSQIKEKLDPEQVHNM